MQRSAARKLSNLANNPVTKEAPVRSKTRTAQLALEASPQKKGAADREPTPTAEQKPSPRHQAAYLKSRGSKRPAPNPASPEKLTLTSSARASPVMEKRNTQNVRRKLTADYIIPADLTVDSQGAGSQDAGSQDVSSMAGECSQRPATPPWACGQGEVVPADDSVDPDMTCMESPKAEAADDAAKGSRAHDARPRLSTDDLLCGETMPPMDARSVATLTDLIQQMRVSLCEVRSLQDKSSRMLVGAQTVMESALEMEEEAREHKDEAQEFVKDAKDDAKDALELWKTGSRKLRLLNGTVQSFEKVMDSLGGSVLVFNEAARQFASQTTSVVEAAEVLQKALPVLRLVASRCESGGSMAQHFDAFNAGVCSPSDAAGTEFVKASALLKPHERVTSSLRLDTSVGRAQPSGLYVRSKATAQVLDFGEASPPRGAGAAPMTRRFGNRTKRNSVVYYSDLSDHEDGAPKKASAAPQLRQEPLRLPRCSSANYPSFAPAEGVVPETPPRTDADSPVSPVFGCAEKEPVQATWKAVKP